MCRGFAWVLLSIIIVSKFRRVVFPATPKYSTFFQPTSRYKPSYRSAWLYLSFSMDHFAFLIMLSTYHPRILAAQVQASANNLSHAVSKRMVGNRL